MSPARQEATGDSLLHLTVFLSSPGDVHDERRIAREILEELPRRPAFRGKVFVEIVAWDDPYARTPLTANETPQRSVNRFNRRPSECDVTVVILWSRIGTALPPDERKPDGSRYASGTEWEFEDARSARKSVLVYHRTEPPKLAPDALDLVANRSQYEAVRQFLNRSRNPDGSANWGYHDYESPKAFESLFRDHMEAMFREKLEGASEIDQHRRDFSDELLLGAALVGRRDVFEMIDAFVLSHRCGYFRLTAEPGLGKTALAAAVAKARNAVCFFTSRSRGCTSAAQCLNHLSAELITRYGLPYRRLPVRSGEDSGFFESMLQEAIESAARPLWLVIDALDESDASMGRNALLLPRSLPDGVYCFVTQRPGDYLVDTDPATPITDCVLTWDSPTQQADILEFIEREVSRPAISRALRAAMPGRNGAFFAAELARLSEGNFMYLSYLMGDLATGQWSVATPDGAAVLPKGLRGYYAAIWGHMEEVAQAAGGSEWRSLYRPVIGLLAVAREPVTSRWLADLSGCDPEDVQNPVLSRCGRFLSHERRNGVERWRILHRSFGDFLSDKLDLDARHAVIGRYYGEPSSWSSHDGYASRHLCAHLRSARSMDALSRLIDDRAWCESQMAADPTGVRYETDVQDAWSLAASLDTRAAHDGRMIPALSDEIKAALASTTLRDLWTNIPSDTIDALLEVEILSGAQVLGFIERIEDEEVRSRLLLSLATRLSASQLPKACSLAQLMSAEHRARILLAVAERMTGDERNALIGEALCSVRAMDPDRSKPELLCQVAAELTGQLGTECRHEALDLAARVVDPCERAFVLAGLVAYIPETLDALQHALIDARASTESDENPGETLVEIVERVPPRQRSQVAAWAVPLALELRDSAQRALALIALVGDLPENDRDGVQRAALEAARSIEEPAMRADHLLDLGGKLPEPERAALLEEARQCLLETADPGSRILGLIRLAGCLPEEHGRSVLDRALGELSQTGAAPEQLSLVASSVQHLPGELKEVALQTARRIVSDLPDRFAKARGLIQIGQACSGRQMRQLLQEAAAIPGGILAIGEPEKDDVERVELLGAVVADLGPSERDRVQREAMATAQAVEKPYDRALALASLLAAFAPEDRSTAASEVRTVANALERPDQRAELLAALIPYVTGDDQSSVLHGAIESARSIEPGHLEYTGVIDMRTGAVKVDRAPRIMGRPSLAMLGIALTCEGRERAERIAEALDSLRDLPAHLQPGVLTELSPHLSSQQLRDVLADYRKILHDPLRAEFQRWLSGRLGVTPSSDEPLPREANDGEWSCDFPFPEHVFGLNRMPGQAAFVIAIEPTPRWEDDAHKERVERELIRRAADQALGAVAAEELRPPYDAAVALSGVVWHRAIGLLLQRMAVIEPADAVLTAAHAIWPDRIPSVVAALIAPCAPPAEAAELVAAALAAAPDLTDPEDRATLLMFLLPRLQPPESQQALVDLDAAIRATPGGGAISRLIETFSAQSDGLPAPALLLFVQHVLRSADCRRGLFTSLRELLPVLRRLAGPSLDGSVTGLALRAPELGHAAA